MMDKIEAGHPGHANVGDDTIKSLSALGRRQKVARGSKARWFNILAGEIKAQRVKHCFIVVNDRDVQAIAHVWVVFAIGSVKWTAPPCAPLSSHNLPPWASTIDRHSGKPMPRPSALLDASGRNAFSLSCAGNPGPESATRTSTKSASKILASIRTV